MYHCENCDHLIGANMKQHRVVTKRRPKRYVNTTSFETKVSQGWEASEEKLVYEPCYRILIPEEESTPSILADNQLRSALEKAEELLKEKR